MVRQFSFCQHLNISQPTPKPPCFLPLWSFFLRDLLFLRLVPLVCPFCPLIISNNHKTDQTYQKSNTAGGRSRAFCQSAAPNRPVCIVGKSWLGPSTLGQSKSEAFDWQERAIYTDTRKKLRLKVADWSNKISRPSNDARVMLKPWNLLTSIRFGSTWSRCSGSKCIYCSYSKFTHVPWKKHHFFGPWVLADQQRITWNEMGWDGIKLS